MSSLSDELVVSTYLETSPPDELSDITLEERRAETFLLYTTGWQQAQIARRFGISQATVSKDIAIELRRRRTRAENIEDEIERIAGVYEGVMSKAWSRHNEAAEASPTSVAGTNYLRLVMDAAEKVAQIRGIDAGSGTKKQDKGQTRVVVRIGGSSESPQIDVGVES